MFPLLLAAAAAGPVTDEFDLGPAYQETCIGEDISLDICSRPGDFAVLLVAKAPGLTEIPGVGTFGIPIDPFPIVLELGIVPASGCWDVDQLVPCDCAAVEYYTQGLSVNPSDMSILVSDVAQIEIKTVCQDWDGNGINDTCDSDCDGDGVIDGLELDSDGDGIPNDCDEVCEAPEEPCDEGCWKLLDKPADSGGPDGTYGLRLDGLFGDHSDNMYTFSFEHEGTDVQMCHDKDADTLTLSGLVYGGLGLAPNWDPALEGYAYVEFTWTGTKCKNDKLKVKESSGGGSGTFTWLETGEVLQLGPKADSDGVYAIVDDDLLLHAWVMFDGMPNECCQDFKAGGTPAATCP